MNTAPWLYPVAVLLLLPALACIGLYAWRTPGVITREGAETRRQIAVERTRVGALVAVERERRTGR